jgi:hypothetical protein
VKKFNLAAYLKGIYSAIPSPWRFSIAVWLGLRMFYAVWGMITISLFPLSVQNFEFQGMPVVTIFNLETSQAYLYERQVGEKTLTFRMLDRNTVLDEQTGSHWLVSTGEVFGGFFTGQRLTRSDVSPEEIFPYLGVQAHPNSSLSVWQRFDTNWYLSIAERGYGAVSGDEHFPPLYPALIRLVGFLIGDLFLAGLLISHFASLLVIKLLYDFFHEWLSPFLAKRALTFFLIFPASYYLFAAYSESLYFLFVLLFLRLCQDKAWILAGACMALAILTRLHGVALFPVLLYAMYTDKPFLKRISHWSGMFVAGLGGVVYLLLRYFSGSESVLPIAESEWYVRLAFPWETFAYAVSYLLAGQMSLIDLTNFIVVIAVVLLVLLGWRKIPKLHLLYVVFSVIIMTSRVVETQPFSAIVRYSLSLFPLFGLLSLYARQKSVERFVIVIFLLYMLYFSAQFWLWGWVA